jgi:hypothetical protein
MAKLTKRERVMRTMRFEDTDRPPLYDIFQNDAIIEHYSGDKLAPGNGARLTGLAVGAVLDMTRMSGGPNETLGRFPTPEGWEYQHERWTGWITKRPFHDEVGCAEWIKQQISSLAQVEHGQATRDGFHAYIQERQACFAQGDPDGDPTVLIVESLPGLTHVYSMATHELLAYILADQPGLIEEWMEAMTEVELKRIAAIADPELIPLALTADDLAFKTSLLFSPEWLRQVFMQRLKRLNDSWHERGALCIFHSDGNLWPIIDDLIAAGIDGLNPLERLASMHPADLRKAYPHLVLTGGIDVSQLLTFGTPGEVREAVLEAIEATDGRGYFVGSSTELHWDVSLQNALMMFDTVKNWRRG